MSKPQTKARRIKIRPARDADGQTIKHLLTSHGTGMASTLEQFDWSRIEPYWLVAEIEGRVIGCIQVIPSLPVAHIEFLHVSDELGHKDRAMSVKLLAETAMGIAMKAGAAMSMSTVAFAHKRWKRVLKRRGAVAASQANVMVKRLQA